MLDVLSAEQQQKLDQLKGKPLDLKLLARAAAPVFSEYPKELINSKFENGTDGWIVEAQASQATVEADTETIHEGKQSLRISAEEPTERWLAQVIRLHGPAMYRLRGWVKTKDLDPRGASVFGTFQIRTPNSDRAIATGENHQGTSDWSEVRIVFETPSDGAVRIVPFFVGYGRGTGTVWFDDLTIEELSMAEMVDQIFIQNQPFDFDFSVSDPALC
jgi:hypothetical protein